jgi:hypothetical protein
MAKGAPPAFLKKSGGKGKPNPFGGKKAAPFGAGAGAGPAEPPMAFKKGGRAGRK